MSVLADKSNMFGIFKGCVADCPVVTDLFSRSSLKASFQYFGMALHNPK